MMWGYGWGVRGFLMMGFAGLIWLVLLGLAIWAVARLLSGRTLTGGPPSSGPTASGPTAMEILRQRYARGEIDDATFAQMRERLEGGRSVDGEAVPPELPRGSSV